MKLTGILTLSFLVAFVAFSSAFEVCFWTRQGPVYCDSGHSCCLPFPNHDWICCPKTPLVQKTVTTTKPVQPEHASGLPGGVVAAIVISVLAMCSFLAFCLYKKCKHGHSGEIHCTTCSVSVICDGKVAPVSQPPPYRR